MKILLATSNPHKLGEILAVIEAVRTAEDEAIVLVGLDSLGRVIDEPVEDQDTFEGNAILKARYYANESGMICMADDSGLEVDALDGEPGVRSARYSGATGGRDVVDPANNRLLLERLGDTPAERRTARFVCAMALAWPKGLEDHSSVAFCHRHPDEPIVVRGTIEGRIIGPHESERGLNGFGYDPLFFVPTHGCTSAELPPEEKNRISHRGAATRLMIERLRGLAR